MVAEFLIRGFGEILSKGNGRWKEGSSDRRKGILPLGRSVVKFLPFHVKELSVSETAFFLWSEDGKLMGFEIELFGFLTEVGATFYAHCQPPNLTAQY